MNMQDEFVRDLTGTISETPSRLIIVVWIGLLGFVQLSMASVLQAEFGGFKEGITIAYAGIGGMMPIYVLLPFFDCGARYYKQRAGKVVAIVSGLGMLASMAWILWRVNAV